VLTALRERLKEHPWGEPVTDREVLRTLGELQRKVEVENESIRRDVLRYDLVVDQQRSTIFAWRQTLLDQRSDETVALVEQMAQELFGAYAERLASSDFDERDAARTELLEDAAEVLGEPQDDGGASARDPFEHTMARVRVRLTELRQALGTSRFASLVGSITLATIDELWTDHLGDLERVEDAVGLRDYAELDPVVEFTREAREAYAELQRHIAMSTLTNVLSLDRDAGERGILERDT
jgi:preprotein translocase subunit SecA